MNPNELPVDWFELQKSTLDADGYRCSKCGRDYPLYTVYRQPPDEYGWGLENLTTVCAHHAHPAQRTEAQLARGDHEPMAEFDPSMGIGAFDGADRTFDGEHRSPSHVDDEPNTPLSYESQSSREKVTITVPYEFAYKGVGFLSYRTYPRMLFIWASIAVPLFLVGSILWGILRMWTANSMSAGFRLIGSLWGSAIGLTWTTLTTPTYLLGFFAVTYFVHLLKRDYMNKEWPAARTATTLWHPPKELVIGSIAVYLLAFTISGIGAYTDFAQQGFQYYVVIIGGLLVMMVSLLTLSVGMADLLVYDMKATDGAFRAFFWDYLSRMSVLTIVYMFTVPPSNEAVETVIWLSPVIVAVTYLARRRYYVIRASSGDVPMRKRLMHSIADKHARVKDSIGRFRSNDQPRYKDVSYEFDPDELDQNNR